MVPYDFVWCTEWYNYGMVWFCSVVHLGYGGTKEIHIIYILADLADVGRVGLSKSG
jgi:hypothetical protein